MDYLPTEEQEDFYNGDWLIVSDREQPQLKVVGYTPGTCVLVVKEVD